jgi:hypothetical protein
LVLSGPDSDCALQIVSSTLWIRCTLLHCTCACAIARFCQVLILIAPCKFSLLQYESDVHWLFFTILVPVPLPICHRVVTCQISAWSQKTIQVIRDHLWVVDLPGSFTTAKP